MASSENKTIAKNTIFLYIRMLFLIFVQLYSVPIVLRTLGVVDYGIYNVVGGIVTMFSFIGTALASGSQRFLAYSIGKSDEEELIRVFNTTTTIYLVISVIFVIILELAGVWFLNTHMQIPGNRVSAANWVFQLSLATFVIGLISIPYNSAIVAHEKMSIYAYVTIAEGVLKLLAAICLQYINYDCLIGYAIMLFSISLCIRLVYQIYCMRRFVECRKFKLGWDKSLGHELVSYSGWNMIGSIALIGRNQGLNLVINVFFGPVLNAAHSIAMQISGVLTQFINNIYMATRPRITKLYAKAAYDEMWGLVYNSSKWTFYLLSLISIPAILELKQVLALWLGENVPPYTYEMSVLLILTLLIETMTNQIIAVFQAQNRIMHYQLLSSTILLLNIPISYVLLRYYCVGPIVPYAVSSALSVIYIISLLFVAKTDINLNLWYFLKNVLLRMIITFLPAFVLCYYFVAAFPATIFRLFSTCLVSALLSLVFIWLFGIDKSEKSTIINYVIKRIKQ